MSEAPISSSGLVQWWCHVQIFTAVNDCRCINVSHATADKYPWNWTFIFRLEFGSKVSNQKAVSMQVHATWNKVKCQLDATRSLYWCILSSTCFGYISPSSGALDVELQHMVFCTEFLDGWWSWEPLCTVWMVPYGRKPYAATQHLMLLMMGVFTRNMSS